MRRLASFSKCLMRFDIQGSEAFDENMGIEYFEFKAAFVLSVISGKTFPRKFKLKNPSYADIEGYYALRSENFTRYEPQDYSKTKSDACRRYLEMVAGTTLGVCDIKPPPRRGGYAEEIFRPILTVPEFGSLKELNLKLDVMGA